MKFGTWNVRSLITVATKIAKYKLDLVGVQGSDGTGVAPNQQTNIHFSMERGMRIMNYVQFFCTQDNRISS
jgi:hypothetical protein